MPLTPRTPTYGGTGSASRTLSSFTVARPSGLASGDLCFIFAASDSTSAVTFTTPAGFTAIPRTNVSGESVQLFYRVCDGTESSTFTLAMSAAADGAAVCIAYPGAITSPVFDPSAPAASGNPTSGSTVSVTASSITTASNGDQLIWFGCCITALSAGVSISAAPSGFAFQGPGYTTTAATAGVGVRVADKTQASAGATGTLTGTAASSCDETFGLVVAITPAPVYPAAGTAAATSVAAGAKTASGQARALAAAIGAPLPAGPVNQWAATFAQAPAFGACPPALQSVVVPLTPAASAGGSGTPTPGNWLFVLAGMNEPSATAGNTVNVRDDIGGLWHPAAVSQLAGATRVACWYTANTQRQAQCVYVSPGGTMDAISVLVVEVAGLGPWDSVTGLSSGYSAAATSLAVSLAAPPAPSFVIAAACGDLAGAGQATTPAGWAGLTAVTAANGTDHTSDAVLTAACTMTSAGVTATTTAASASDLASVIVGVQRHAPSPIPAGWRNSWPWMKAEAAFGAGYSTPDEQLTWTDVTNRWWSWHEVTGTDFQLGTLRSSDTDVQLDNSTGDFSPGNPGSCFYSNALNVNMSFNRGYPYAGVLPWTPAGNAQIAQSAAHAFASAPNVTANYSCMVTPDGVTAGPGAQSEMDPVTAGSVYSASAWFYTAAGWVTGAQAVITWYDASKTLLSSSAGAATAIPAGVFTQALNLAVTAPAGAAWATVTGQLAGTPPAAPFWLAECAIAPGPSAVRTGLVTDGTPFRLRMAIGTTPNGTAVNRWYEIRKHFSSFPLKRNPALRGFADAKLTDVWSICSGGSCPSPYRGEVSQDNPGWHWPMDDAAGLAGVLPVILRNAVGGALPLNIVQSPLGSPAQDPWIVRGYRTTENSGTGMIATYNVAQESGWMPGDQASSPASGTAGGAVTAQPGSAAWQQVSVGGAFPGYGNTGSYGWFLSVNDPTFPPLSGGVTVETWFKYAFFGNSEMGAASGAPSGARAVQPYCPLTIATLTSATGATAILQLDVAGHLSLITYSAAGTPTTHPVYSASDLRSGTWHHVAVELTATTWAVWVDAGLTGSASGTTTAMAASWQWLILNGDMGSGPGSATSQIAHSGEIKLSHAAVYAGLLPASRIMARYMAAICAFGQLPAPAQVQVQLVAAGAAGDGSIDTNSPSCLYGGSGGGGSFNPVTMTARIVAVAGNYTSPPSAWAAGSYYGRGMLAWISFTGLAPQFKVYTGSQLGSEGEASVTGGAGDSYYYGYGAAANGQGFCHLAAGDGSAPPSAASGGPLGDTVGQRIERLLSYGGITGPRCIDPAPEIVQAAADIGGTQPAQGITNMALSDDGLLCVTNGGALAYRQRPHLAADTPAWNLGPDVTAGQIPYKIDQQFDWDPVNVWNAIEIAPYSPDGSTLPVITPANASAVRASQKQHGVKSLQATSYLARPGAWQAQADWIFANFGQAARRIPSLTVDAASHPDAWPFVAGVNIGDVITVTDRPLGSPPSVGVFRISNITRVIAFGANGNATEGSVTLQAERLPPSYWV